MYLHYRDVLAIILFYDYEISSIATVIIIYLQIASHQKNFTWFCLLS